MTIGMIASNHLSPKITPWLPVRLECNLDKLQRYRVSVQPWMNYRFL
jgi:hypothetical protein